ncbi:hypothetical protein KAX75_05135, partial [candidate division WOR-3 bacterium]|nr:hypothetical protein [candidate division WOR-3 bacterium]
MKNCRKLFLIGMLFSFLASPIHAVITFERWYGGINIDIGNSVVQTFDGGYIVTGYTASFGAGSNDVYLVKTDSLGDTIWTKTYGCTSWDAGYSVIQTSDGGYIIAGNTDSFGSGSFDIYLIKTDSLGDTVWTKTYGGDEFDKGSSVFQTSYDGYIIAGYTYSFGAGNSDVYLIKTDSLGDTLWTKTYGGSEFDKSSSVFQTSNGGYIIGGYTQSFGTGEGDVYLIKTDSVGDTIWTKTYGGSNPDVGSSVAQISDGGYIISGGTTSFATGNSDVYLIKTDSFGDTVWTKTYGGTSWDVGYSVVQTYDEGYVVAAVTTSFGAGNYDVYLIKTDSLGDTIWTKTYGGTGGDIGYSVSQTSDRGYIIAGLTNSFGVNSLDIYLIKTDSLGNVTGIKEEKDQRHKTTDMKLSTSPNPFTTSTTIHLLGIGHSAEGKELKIYNITGRLVKKLSLLTAYSLL